MRHVLAIVLLVAAVSVMFWRRDVPPGIPAGDTPPTPATPACDAQLQRAAPCFTPFDRPLKLRSPKDAQMSLVRSYPKHLSERGIGGTADVFVLVDDEGNVRNALIDNSSGVAELDSAARRVASEMVFAAPRYQGRPTWVWVEVPIVYRTK
jgi:TonB family protein